MNPESAVGWAQYLTNPYAVTGFVVIVFAGIAGALITRPSTKLKSSEMYGLLRLVIIGGFVLGTLAIVFSFVGEHFKPKQQSIGNVKDSDVAVGGRQAAVINPSQTTTMKPNAGDCNTGDQSIGDVTNSRVALADCESSTTARP